MNVFILVATLAALCAVGQKSRPIKINSPLRIPQPAHASRTNGPSVEIRWQIDDGMRIGSQSIIIDKQQPVALAGTARSYAADFEAAGVHSVQVKADVNGKHVTASTTFFVYRSVQLSSAKLYTIDLSSLQKTNLSDTRQTNDAFDTLHVISVLQGLVNREVPRLYVNYTSVDQFWLDKMREKGAYLEHVKLAPLSGVEDALRTFAGHVKGVVVWDPNLPCTSHIASTICGVENLLPVRYDQRMESMYDRLVLNGPRLKVVHDLVGKFSAKCDAYLWAKERYIDTGKCNPTEIGYWCDAFWLKHPTEMSLENVGLTNHDYIVARKGFLCDLDVWADEAPRDDPDQKPGTDRETLQAVLLSCWKSSNGKMVQVSGFTPWAIKYTNYRSAGGKHEPVPTEWETTKLLSSYNAFLDADAIGYTGMANASVFAHYPLPDRLVQNRPPTRAELEAKGYIDKDGKVGKFNFVYYYLGDYDSAAWVYHRMPGLWNNPERGTLPAGWAFNPNLIERIPVAFDWFYRTKSASDYFIAGDSGAGYVNPTQLLPPRGPSGLPSGADAWVEHCADYYRKLNYSITGFLLNGSAGALNDETIDLYRSFSGDGVITQTHWLPGGKKHDQLIDSIVVAEMKRDISGSPDDAANQIVPHGKPGETAFLSFRSILVSPEWTRAVNDKIREKRPECRFEPVDPYTYCYLLRYHLGGSNDHRATFTFDTMPARVERGERLRVTIGVRNEGWDVWKRTGPESVRIRGGFVGVGAGAADAAVPHDVQPGDGAVVELELTAPSKPGKWTLRLEPAQGGHGFRESGDLPWEEEVMVR